MKNRIINRPYLIPILVMLINVWTNPATLTTAIAQSTSQFHTGVTFTQYTLDAWGNSEAIARGKSLLENSTHIVNQHIMGFGALNPEPFPDQYEFDSIAKRIGANDSVGGDAALVTLTACCAPDWMKGGVVGETDWSRIEVAPLPEHFDDYAELVAEIVGRPEFAAVTHVQVWNEMKGFWDRRRNRWNHEAYTELYNAVWTAVKQVRPDIKIGGPYVVLNTFGADNFNSAEVGGVWGKFDRRDLEVVTYWLRHKRGADFISVDAKTNNRDGVHPVDPFARTHKFADFMRWLRGLDDVVYPGASTLPLWWSEWYVSTDDEAASHGEKNALMATGLIRTIKSGADAALIWAPQGDASGNSFPLGLFSDTRLQNGGRATAFHRTQHIINQYFSNGTRLLDVVSENPSVVVLASATHRLLVNTTGQAQTVRVDNAALTLSPLDVRLVETPMTRPALSVVDQLVSEADGQADIAVHLRPPSSQPVSVTAFTRAGSATPSVDFYGKTRQLIFQPGDSIKILPITILNDVAEETDETVEIHLTAASNASLANSIGLLTLVDNDGDTGQPEFYVQSTVVDEAAGVTDFDVNLSRPSPATTSVVAFTRAVSATPGRDYYGATRLLEFPAGVTKRTLAFQVIDDFDIESDETVRVRLVQAQGAPIAIDRANLVIDDDD